MLRPGIVLDLDESGAVVGIDIEKASLLLDLPGWTPPTLSTAPADFET